MNTAKVSLVIFLPLVIFSSFIIFHSCSDSGVINNNTDPTAIEVNGKVVDNSGFAVAGADVSIGAQVTTTATDGSFTIQSVSTPYDVKVLITDIQSFGYLFQGLRSSTPKLSTGPYASEQFNTTLTTTIPALTGNQRAFIIFTNQNDVEKSAMIVQPNISTTMNVMWKGNNSITGKVIVFVVEFLNGEVLSYEKYGERSVTLNNAVPKNEIFQDSHINFNPVESNISGVFSIPAGYSQQAANFVINYKQSGSLIYPLSSGTTLSTVSGFNYTFVVPTGLPTPFRCIIACSAGGSNSYEFTSKSIVTIPGSSNNNVYLEAFATLLSPPANQSGVDLNTDFIVNSGSGTGVMVFTFEGPDRIFQVTTPQSNSKIPDLTSLGISIGTNLNYSWSVSKYGNLNTVDEFVSGCLYDNPSIVYFTNSTERNFHTAVP
jgi:hypothetical protein